ncbi:MAG: hypothetical protein MUF27_06080 [Acidobacteria bacterium]|jgi:hypothetical protein|nr:hypothetical protein [Acidobacteriota bacterium]
MAYRGVWIVALLLFARGLPAAAQQPAAPPPPGGADHVAALKQSLQQSAAALRTYQWVETTRISVKGEEKARTEKSCYYGADGKVQKSPIGAPVQEEGKKPRGLRGKIVENKKEEMTAAMKEAVALVKEYVPPDPARIQAAKDQGRLTLTPPDAKGQVRITIKDYLKPGDSLTLDVNAATNRLSSLTVATFTDSAKDAVGLNVAFGALQDGTVYASSVKLDVTAQNLAVGIENSGYRKVGG